MHRAICVSDLDRSATFYRTALGFQDHGPVNVSEGAHIDGGSKLTTARVRERDMRRPDGPVVRLRQFLHPVAEGPRTRRSTLQYGLVHLSFYVDDIDAWASRIVLAGGAAWQETRAHYEENHTTMLYCTDPDGVRIELMKSPGESERFSHGGICVHDIDASMAFYARFGFSAAENYVLDQGGLPWLDAINEVSGIRLRAQMVRDPQRNTIELLKVFSPACFGPRKLQPENRFGLTHLTFADDDGRGPFESRSVADPDGVRIELLSSTR